MNGVGKATAWRGVAVCVESPPPTSKVVCENTSGL